VLSAQFTVAATGRPSDILNLLPADPPRPVFSFNPPPTTTRTKVLRI